MKSLVIYEKYFETRFFLVRRWKIKCRQILFFLFPFYFLYFFGNRLLTCCHVCMGNKQQDGYSPQALHLLSIPNPALVMAVYDLFFVPVKLFCVPFVFGEEEMCSNQQEGQPESGWDNEYFWLSAFSPLLQISKVKGGKFALGCVYRVVLLNDPCALPIMLNNSFRQT